MLGILERIAAVAPRHYHSGRAHDHGQSQGEPFADRYGTALGDLCAELTHGATSGVEDNVEGWGRVDSVLEDLAGDHAGSKHVPPGRLPACVGHHVQPATRESQGELVVLGSGNLGLVYVPGRERMLSGGDRTDVAGGWCPGSPGTPGSDSSRPWPRMVRSPSGRPGAIDLATGGVEGDDPMAIFGAHAAAMVRAAADMPDGAGPLREQQRRPRERSRWPPSRPLVGAHGGLGGWQDRAFVLAPGEIFAPDVPIVGGDELHRYLVGMLDKLGHRTHLAGTATEDL